MAIQYHPPCLLPFSSPNLLFSPGHHRRLSWRTTESPPRRKLLVCASSASKPRRSRKLKSDGELCNEVREFVSMVGLPEGHLPTLKEFSKQGRNDLANIVRRKGYKLMKELLANSIRVDLDGVNGEKCLVENHGVAAKLEENLAGALSFEDTTVVKDVSSDNQNFIKESVAYSLEEQNEKAQAKVGDLFGSTNGSARGKYLESLTVSPNHKFGDQKNRPADSLAISTLERQVSEFIQNGDLDEIEDSVLGFSNGREYEENKPSTKMKDGETTRSVKNDRNWSEHVHYAAPVLNGNSLILKEEEVDKSSKRSFCGADSSEAEQLKDNDLEDLNLESTRRDGKFEIDRLKFMLNQKEMELSRLKEQLEKEKVGEVALSALQIRAEAEINKAQELVSQKDAELLAAEESLSGLEEVQIDYYGEGDIVEVAGSFNGWHQRIKMDPHPSSGVIDSVRSRRSKIWSTVLWLYPGTYEIKFIVDGQWTIDPQREIVNSGGMCNNILRVDDSFGY